MRKTLLPKLGRWNVLGSFHWRMKNFRTILLWDRGMILSFLTLDSGSKFVTDPSFTVFNPGFEAMWGLEVGNTIGLDVFKGILCCGCDDPHPSYVVVNLHSVCNRSMEFKTSKDVCRVVLDENMDILDSVKIMTEDCHVVVGCRTKYGKGKLFVFDIEKSKEISQTDLWMHKYGPFSYNPNKVQPVKMTHDILRNVYYVTSDTLEIFDMRTGSKPITSLDHDLSSSTFISSLLCRSESHELLSAVSFSDFSSCPHLKVWDLRKPSSCRKTLLDNSSYSHMQELLDIPDTGTEKGRLVVSISKSLSLWDVDKDYKLRHQERNVMVSKSSNAEIIGGMVYVPSLMEICNPLLCVDSETRKRDEEARRAFYSDFPTESIRKKKEIKPFVKLYKKKGEKEIETEKDDEFDLILRIKGEEDIFWKCHLEMVVVNTNFMWKMLSFECGKERAELDETGSVTLEYFEEDAVTCMLQQIYYGHFDWNWCDNDNDGKIEVLCSLVKHAEMYQEYELMKCLMNAFCELLIEGEDECLIEKNLKKSEKGEKDDDVANIVFFYENEVWMKVLEKIWEESEKYKEEDGDVKFVGILKGLLLPFFKNDMCYFFQLFEKKKEKEKSLKSRVEQVKRNIEEEFRKKCMFCGLGGTLTTRLRMNRNRMKIQKMENEKRKERKRRRDERSNSRFRRGSYYNSYWYDKKEIESDLFCLDAEVVSIDFLSNIHTPQIPKFRSIHGFENIVIGAKKKKRKKREKKKDSGWFCSRKCRMQHSS